MKNYFCFLLFVMILLGFVKGNTNQIDISAKQHYATQSKVSDYWRYRGLKQSLDNLASSMEDFEKGYPIKSKDPRWTSLKPQLADLSKRLEALRKKRKKELWDNFAQDFRFLQSDVANVRNALTQYKDTNGK
jgi:hypothetical protein